MKIFKVKNIIKEIVLPYYNDKKLLIKHIVAFIIIEITMWGIVFKNSLEKGNGYNLFVLLLILLAFNSRAIGRIKKIEKVSENDFHFAFTCCTLVPLFTILWLFIINISAIDLLFFIASFILIWLLKLFK